MHDFAASRSELCSESKCCAALVLQLESCLLHVMLLTRTRIMTSIHEMATLCYAMHRYCDYLHGIIKQDAQDLLRAQPPPGSAIPPAHSSSVSGSTGGAGAANKGGAKKGVQGKSSPGSGGKSKSKAAPLVNQALLAEVRPLGLLA